MGGMDSRMVALIITAFIVSIILFTLESRHFIDKTKEYNNIFKKEKKVYPNYDINMLHKILGNGGITPEDNVNYIPSADPFTGTFKYPARRISDLPMILSPTRNYGEKGRVNIEDGNCELPGKCVGTGFGANT